MHPCQYFTHFASSLVLGDSNFNNTYFNGFRFFGTPCIASVGRLVRNIIEYGMEK